MSGFCAEWNDFAAGRSIGRLNRDSTALAKLRCRRDVAAGIGQQGAGVEDVDVASLTLLGHGKNLAVLKNDVHRIDENISAHRRRGPLD